MADRPPIADGPALTAALDALNKDLMTEAESAAKYNELNVEADKHRAKATGKVGDRKKRYTQYAATLVALRKSGKLSAEEVAAAQERLDAAQRSLDAVERVTPSTGSFFVRLFLGQVNVRSTSKADCETLRNEYEKFKDRTNYGFMIFPLIWIVNQAVLRHTWRYTDWIYILTHIWLFYYYISLSLRENILRVNGSNIRQWWIYHHYVSACMSVIVLTWPAGSKSWERFLPQFTAYFMYQGIVQFMQARYQKARHYARRALGKANHMDISNTETIAEFHAGLWIIVGLVIVAQGWQIFNGLSLFRLLMDEMNLLQPWYEFREEVQCVSLGVLFCFLGVMNFTVTVQTLLEKSRKERVRSLRLSAAAGGAVDGDGRGAAAGMASPGGLTQSSATVIADASPLVGKHATPPPSTGGAGVGAVDKGDKGQ